MLVSAFWRKGWVTTQYLAQNIAVLGEAGGVVANLYRFAAFRAVVDL